MSKFWLLALIGCIGDVEVEQPPEPVPVEVPVPAASDLTLSEAVTFEANALLSAPLKGSPVLQASFTLVLETLRTASPAAERVERVAALREKGLADVPAEDASGTALREAFGVAINDALSSFFIAYAHSIVSGEATDKADHVEALEAVLMTGGWDWDLATRDAVQAKLMMAQRGL